MAKPNEHTLDNPLRLTEPHETPYDWPDDDGQPAILEGIYEHHITGKLYRLKDVRVADSKVWCIYEALESGKVFERPIEQFLFHDVRVEVGKTGVRWYPRFAYTGRS